VKRYLVILIIDKKTSRKMTIKVTYKTNSFNYRPFSLSYVSDDAVKIAPIKFIEGSGDHFALELQLSQSLEYLKGKH
jgi:hypothetical protein